MASNTPICDFVRAYAASSPVRLHMPGHKGEPVLGCEPWDVTEIDGADALFEADGIIRESERIAGRFFGAQTFYSAEGSSLCIRAMLALAVRRMPAGTRPKVLAPRNVHKTFLSAAALLDFDPVWIGTARDGRLGATVTAAEVEAALDESTAAVYLTAPDYLGNLPDLAPIAAVCRRANVPLLVDNAHGAYLKFLKPSRHPIDLGADLCCDSAHKTLAALTGAAYLHVAPSDRFGFAARAKDALALFGSTSPSYLILQSLDAQNGLFPALPDRIESFLPQVDALRKRLQSHGYRLLGDEPLKITVDANAFGYTGDGLAALLAKRNVVAEFHDPQYLVLMLSPRNTPEDLTRAADALCAISPREPIEPAILPPIVPTPVLSVRAAMLAEQERLPVEECVGRILAEPCVGCPPAVPIRMCGERIDAAAAQWFRFYGVKTLAVVKNA